MALKRTDRINELLRARLGSIVAREIEFPKETVVAITNVSVTGDLKKATVFVSVFPDLKHGSCLRVLKKHRARIQHVLNRQLALYSVPRIHFAQEKSDHILSVQDEVDELIRILHKEQ